jgi:hypothetical protein
VQRGGSHGRHFRQARAGVFDGRQHVEVVDRDDGTLDILAERERPS